jgi:hypothetical protein
MTIPTLLCGSLLCAVVCAVAQDSTPPVIACNTKAISMTDRPRYNDLTKRFRSAIRNRSEIRDGYTFQAGRTNSQFAGGRGLDQHGTALLPLLDFSTFNLGISIRLGLEADWPGGCKGPPPGGISRISSS